MRNDGRTDRLPITVLTGFLGSGKTTLVNALLRDSQFRNTAIIVNEFGDIGLDHLLVASSTDNIVLLDSGCLCCAVSDSFKETLADLYYRRARADVPPFDRVLVETSGLADPTPTLQILLRDSFVAHYFELTAGVTTLDAMFGAEQLKSHSEAVRQAAVADRIVITKSDMADEERLTELRRTIATLSPYADLHCAQSETFRVDQVLLNSARTPELEVAHASTEAAGDLRHASHARDSAIRAKSFIIDRPVGWAGLAGWTDLIREALGQKLLRCKGLLQVEGVEGPILIQGVQSVFAAPLRLPCWPSEDHRSRIVCITQDVDSNLLEASLSALFAEPGTYRPASINELLPRNLSHEL